MIRLSIFCALIGVFGCAEEGYRQADESWVDELAMQPDLAHTFLSQMQDEEQTLHGKEVKLRGKLVYEYDDAAIYPFGDCADFKPIWIHVDQDEVDLHSFLLKNDDALVTVIGMVDTIEYFDRRQYGGAIKDIVRVDVSHVLAKE